MSVRIDRMAAAQPAANVSRLGRWALGQCEVVHRRAGFLFVSSGPMLEVYQNKHGEYAKSDSILMPGLVRGVWMKNTLSHVYVVCAGAGLRVVSFDAVDGQFLDVVGSLDTPGSANGVMQYGNMAYIADGPGAWPWSTFPTPPSRSCGHAGHRRGRPGRMGGGEYAGSGQYDGAGGRGFSGLYSCERHQSRRSGRL